MVWLCFGGCSMLDSDVKWVHGCGEQFSRPFLVDSGFVLHLEAWNLLQDFLMDKIFCVLGNLVGDDLQCHQDWTLANNVCWIWGQYLGADGWGQEICEFLWLGIWTTVAWEINSVLDFEIGFFHGCKIHTWNKLFRVLNQFEPYGL